MKDYLYTEDPALNFIHFKQIQRLSVDIDFNYRHQGEETDWGEIRNELDENIKVILNSQGYKKNDIKIDASYPLSRFTIKYINHQDNTDFFKIETGYMKRIPILTNDCELTFKHICSQTEFTIKTPRAEELYANKIVTMLDRATPRDLYDVANIEEENANLDILRKCVIIESLISLKKPIIDISPQKIVKTIPYDQRIRSVTAINEDPNIEVLRRKASTLTNTIISNITKKEKRCIIKFYKEKQFEPKLLEAQYLNPDIQNHPGIKWALR